MTVAFIVGITVSLATGTLIRGTHFPHHLIVKEKNIVKKFVKENNIFYYFLL